jgi:type IV pilus assembly protein PilE
MKKYWSGFTLVELIIVVAIVGIIASIAYPSYDQYITRSKRADAMSALMLASQAMERRRSNPPYSYQVSDISDVFATQVPVEGGDAYYILSVTSDDTSYTLTATPTGSMSGKRTLTLTNTGARTWGGDSCWPESGSTC